MEYTRFNIHTIVVHNHDGCDNQEFNREPDGWNIVCGLPGATSVLIGDACQKFSKWKDFLEWRWLKINISETKIMVNQTEGEFPWTKINPCGVCRKIKAHSVQCTKRKNWVNERSTKTEKVLSLLAHSLVIVQSASPWKKVRCHYRHYAMELNN